jgi:lariat debranching enzyme
MARRTQVFRLRQLQREGTSPRLDVFLSHDWPRGIARAGNAAQLCRAKPFLRAEVRAVALHHSLPLA